MAFTIRKQRKISYDVFSHILMLSLNLWLILFFIFSHFLAHSLAPSLHEKNLYVKSYLTFSAKLTCDSKAVHVVDKIYETEHNNGEHMLLRDTHKGGACYRNLLTRVWPPLWNAFFVPHIFGRSANQVLWRISCGKIGGGNYCRAISNWWSHYATVAGCPRMWRRFCVSIYCLYLLVLILRHLLSTGLLMLLWYNLI